MPNSSNNPQALAAQNFANRRNLIETGLHMVKKLQPQTGLLGNSIRVPLERMGVMTGIMLQVTVPVDITAAATVSEYGPYNLLKSVSYTDYAGIQRVLTNGFQLHVLNCFRGHRFLNNSQKMAGYIPGETGIDSNILNVPTAIASDLLEFSIFIPIAYDAMSDLRGAVLSQSITGDHYVTLQLANGLVATDSFAAPYSAGTAKLQVGTTVTVEAFQHYIMPQNGVANLPMVDLSTIYAVEGNFQDSANIVAGQAKYVNWPNNRAIMSALHNFQNGNAGVLNGSDLAGITLLGNSNTNIREMNPRYLRNQMRYNLGADIASGSYFISSRTQPITTRLYGNVQTRFDVTTANVGAYFVNQYESTYLSGTPLPGVIQ